MLELHIGGKLRDRKIDADNQLTGLQCGLEEAGKELVARNRTPVGQDGRAQTQDGRGIAGRRIGVRKRAADGAGIAHHRIADAAGQRRQCRDGTRHLSRAGNRVMTGHGTDADGGGRHGDAGQIADTAQVDQMGGLGQAQLHGLDQTLTTGEKPGIDTRLGGADGLGGLAGTLIVE